MEKHAQTSYGEDVSLYYDTYELGGDTTCCVSIGHIDYRVSFYVKTHEQAEQLFSLLENSCDMNID